VVARLDIADPNHLMHRTIRRAMFSAVLAVASLFGTVAIASPAAAAPQRNVVVYGDSLAWEAKDFVAVLGAANGMPTEVRSFGGTATCDWFTDMRSYLPKVKAQVVVLAFSGNNITPCMRPGGTYLLGDALQAKYAADTKRAITIARSTGARVVLVGAPRPHGSGRDWDFLHEAYRDLAGTSPRWVSYVDGGRLIAPAGAWSRTRSCLPNERRIVNTDGSRACTRTNRIAVRAPDGAHFCPGGAAAVNGITTTCRKYSSGAFRYASTIVRGTYFTLFRRYP
jgi:hypothetical protein